MDMYRRNSCKNWWDDIGFIYAIVIVFITAIFLIRHIGHRPNENTERSVPRLATHADRR